MKFSKKLLLGLMLGAAAASTAYADGQITLIHTGDFHGHLAPRANLRSDAATTGQSIGGLARIKTVIQNIQAGKGGAGNTLVLHTGDTIQGSGEAMYTRGQAMVDVVDMLGIDHYAPGNWDFVYGKDRFVELFASNLNSHLPTLPEQANGAPAVAPPFGTRWGGLVSNVYLTSDKAPLNPTDASSPQGANLTKAEYDAHALWYLEKGQRVLPPYAVRTVNGVKVGILGCTTSRGPQVVGKWVTEGLQFTDCSNEVKKFTRILRNVEQVEVVVLISEIEIGRNIQLIKNLDADQHIDVVLNADMHEEAVQPIEVLSKDGLRKTWIIEEGMDGTMVGEIALSVHSGQVTAMNHFQHRINENVAEDPQVAAKVAEVSYPFNAGFTSVACDLNSPYRNPFSDKDAPTCLKGPLSAAVGFTEVGLHRGNYMNENMPAAIEGSSHDMIADAIRWWAQSDLATVRGFRYGTHVAPQTWITRNDLYHYVPIGPRVGKAARITLNQLRNQIDNSSLAVFSNDPGNVVTPRPSYNNATYGLGGLKQNESPGAGLPAGGLEGNALGWGGGWLFAYSAEGFHMDFDPYFQPTWQRVFPGSATNLTTDPTGIYLGNNTQVTRPAGDTSRARSLKVKVRCKFLPPAEIVSKGCDVNESKTILHETTMTTATDGKYATNWVTNYGTFPNNVLGAAAKDTWLLNPNGWQFLKGTPNNPTASLAVRAPFQAPTFTVAGYWYPQSPNTINNCNNCFPTGYSTVVGHADAAYLLPVNAVVDGNGNILGASLDGEGNPIYKRNTDGSIMIGTDGKPQVEGAAIELTEVVEMYLAHKLGGVVNSSNLPLNRIGLVNPLPTTSAGLQTMQPLCGTIGKTQATATSCP